MCVCILFYITILNIMQYYIKYITFTLPHYKISMHCIYLYII